jgi:hypothetical protein
MPKQAEFSGVKAEVKAQGMTDPDLFRQVRGTVRM